MSTEHKLARDFWRRFDEKRGELDLKEIVEKAGLSYTTLRNQRSGRNYTIPKTAQAAKLASLVNTTVEYLVTGTEPAQIIDPVIQQVLKDPTKYSLVKLMAKATPHQIELMYLALGVQIDKQKDKIV